LPRRQIKGRDYEREALSTKRKAITTTIAYLICFRYADLSIPATLIIIESPLLLKKLNYLQVLLARQQRQGLRELEGGLEYKQTKEITTTTAYTTCFRHTDLGIPAKLIVIDLIFFFFQFSTSFIVKAAKAGIKRESPWVHKSLCRMLSAC
jgi:hypothetical protein